MILILFLLNRKIEIEKNHICVKIYENTINKKMIATKSPQRTKNNENGQKNPITMEY